MLELLDVANEGNVLIAGVVVDIAERSPLM